MTSFIRAGYAGQTLRDRTPELVPLADKSIALFGLGCLGAPSALEFARAGVGGLRLLDPDIVDAATTTRWPRGLAAAGLPKVDVIGNMISAEYPSTRITYISTRTIGQPRPPQAGSEYASDLDVLDEMLCGADLVYDATAEIGVNNLLSDLTRERGVPYVGVSATYGGWGGKAFRVLPGQPSGCWLCYCKACYAGVIPEPPSDPRGVVQPRGCGEPTFTGSGFDMLQIALQAIRLAVSTLCADALGGYPPIVWDVTHISLRDEQGLLIPPKYETYTIARDVDCPYCNG